ncbi:response regulator transcription factor [Streptomyces acidiscabies]|uniref:Regulator n=3 Tax=Streptomyces acidiscabies TaxID=42234 RepID=A0A0L0JCZ2_9ACTN|nr:response regulator transcription factor [Streptomyces acidiscabies]MBP5942259.1 response regulator transcription factor [Streptomyces sp. LBUM 1476]KND23587.1 regulator [Streptomyces acidiscabies]MBZ3913791.1 response regulator transcription factor [Streptomyces acidiscabies]MDX2965266.1 response regulator transcription factor [Streptomyces acidiscabies]MDX3022118.1 response regulator transcription factor [Streptomyces acidiscabies]
MHHKILVVEDDHALRDVLRRGLLDEDFEPVLAADGATALRLAADGIAAVVLDVGLPDADGRDVCQALRANGFAAPVIFLTARHHLTDRLSGFSAGADDYLPKPFHLAELAARLRAAVRRAGPPAVAGAGDLLLDATRHTARAGQADVGLSPTEFRLLATLVAADGALVSRRDLVRAAWPDGAQVSDNTLDQYLSRLRRKLREAGSALSLTTVRGIGHRLS